MQLFEPVNWYPQYNLYAFSKAGLEGLWSKNREKIQFFYHYATPQNRNNHIRFYPIFCCLQISLLVCRLRRYVLWIWLFEILKLHDIANMIGHMLVCISHAVAAAFNLHKQFLNYLDICRF